mgnify:CR=1 FL=1
MFRVVVAVRSGRLVCVGMCDYVWRGEGWTGRHGGGCGWRQGYVATRAGRGRVGGQGGKAAGSPTGPRTASRAAMKDSRKGSWAVSSAAAQISSRMAW